MKKMILFLSMMTFCIAVNSQTKFGIRAGLSLTSVRGESIDKAEDSDSKFSTYPGYTVGVFLDVPISNHLTIQPSLNFTKKGVKKSYETKTVKKSQMLNLDTYQYYDVTVTNSNGVYSEDDLGYIELPILCTYKFKISNIGIQIGVGPYVSYGITSKTTIETKSSYTVFPDKYGSSTSKSDKDDWKSFGKPERDKTRSGYDPFDYGAAAQASITWNRFSLNAGYELGLKNVYISDDDFNKDGDAEFKLGTFLLTLGVIL